MAQRLRYEKTEDQFVVRSKNFYTGDGRQVYIRLHKVAMVYDIYDVNNNDRVLTGGETKSFVVLLRKAKDALLSLGVILEKENRKEYVRGVKDDSQ